MVILKLLPNFAEPFSKWCIRASLFGILLIVIGSSSAGRLNLAAFGYDNAMWIAVYIFMLALLSWLAGAMLGLKSADKTAIEMEVIVRNVNLGVLIKASLFPITATGDNSFGDAVLLTILLYGALQLLISAVYIPVKRQTVSSK